MGDDFASRSRHGEKVPATPESSTLFLELSFNGNSARFGLLGEGQRSGDERDQAAKNSRSRHRSRSNTYAESNAGETILTVPTGVFRSLDAVPKSISQKLTPHISLHGLLAANLALDETMEFAPWSAVFPTRADFDASMPFMWPEELQNLLPKPAKDLLKKQQIKFQRDWDTVSKAFTDMRRKQYLYTWFLINTRSFYYETRNMKKFSNKDKLALLPVADLLNHADSGCQVSTTPVRFTVTADREHCMGEEVYICYGRHSNDFLLTEYGFVPAANRWDEVCLDDVILPHLNSTQKSELEAGGFLGKYMLDTETAGCYRTQVALRRLCCTPTQWRSFVNAEDYGESSQAKVDAFLMQSLNKFLKTIGDTLGNIEKLNVGQTPQQELLAERWKQIENLITQTIQRLEA